MKLSSRLNALIGTLVCIWAATLLSILFTDARSPNALPLLFVAVIVLASHYFGSMAGMIGCITAGLIFATFLYHPIGSPVIADKIARGNLFWMILIGVCASHLVVPSRIQNTKRETSGSASRGGHHV